MALPSNKKKQLLAGLTLLVLVIALAEFWHGNSPTGSNTITGIDRQQKAPDITTSDVNTSGTSTTIIISEPVQSQQSTEINNATTLPPISSEVAKEIRKLSIQNSDGLVEVKQADGSASMDLQSHFQSVTAAAIDENGKIIIHHGEDFLKNVK